MKSAKGSKFDQEKPVYWLLPMDLIESVVRVLTFGAKKYGPENWKKVEHGEKRYYSAAMRHLAAIRQNDHNDHETGESHYAHAVCSILFAWWHNKRRKP